MDIAIIAAKLGAAPWDDTSLETGVGGSGAMLIQFARELAKAHNVTVFCNVKQAGEYHGVTWQDVKETSGKYDVALSIRTPDPLELVEAPVRGHIANDQKWDALPRAVNNGLVNLVITISKHQTKNYQQLYPEIPKEMYLESSAGVDWHAYGKNYVKDTFRCNYTSTPERGLRHLVRIWPRIAEKMPRASLVVTGGFQLYGIPTDKATQMAEGLYEQVAKLPRAEYVGPLTRTALQELQLSSGVWLYPTDYEEQCCISALEAMSARQVLITSPLAALKERVMNVHTGYLINKEPGTPEYDTAFVNRAIEILSSPFTAMDMGRQARKMARLHSYDILAEAWVKRFEEML